MDRLRKFVPKVNFVEDDKLWLLRILCADILNTKVFKIIRYIIISSTFFLLIFQTFLFLEKFDGIYFIKYLAVYAGTFAILVFVYSIIYTQEALSLVNHTISLDEATTRTKKRIELEALYFNSFVVFDSLLNIYCGVLYAIPIEGDDEIFFPLRIFEEYFPKWENLLSGCYRITFIPVSFMMQVILYQTIYGANHLRFQFYLLLDYIERLKLHVTSIENQNVPLYEELHQANFTKTLKIAIQRHSEVYWTTSNLARKLYKYVFIFTVSGVLFCLSIIVFYFTFRGTYEGRYLRICTLVASVVLNFVHAILVGQLLQNISTETFEALQQLDWYCWNEENKKLYLVFLIYAQRTVQLKFSDSMVINYELAISVGKYICSMLSVMSQLKEIDY
ncbi:hypothetical protein Zmor_008523 [Zophobas morio]|uniref:Odorant receptor n=1 Tax=Zophobas morio TaxID=2755281 RepID=A0AA38MQV1_9CUCU|nr:hypothetical protein Zmor_008523 [Zophobas morio]